MIDSPWSGLASAAAGWARVLPACSCPWRWPRAVAGSMAGQEPRLVEPELQLGPALLETARVADRDPNQPG